MHTRLIITLILAGLVSAYGQDPFIDDETQNIFEGGLGVTWIDGESYTTFSLTPDFSFGKFGVGLNIELLFNNSGGFEFRKTGWDKGAGILRAIRYIRYGYKTEPVYVRLGTLDAAVLGHGFLMWYYSNQANYDQRKIGLALDLDFGEFGFESVTSNLGDTEIYGGRAYYRPLHTSEIPILKNMEIGGTFVTDQKVPDDEGGLDESISAWSLDLGLPVITGDLFNTTLYYDHAAFIDFGSGDVIGVQFGFPGLIGLFSLSAKLEKRFLGEQFLPNYFNTLYELERHLPLNQDKRSHLAAAGKTEGIFGQLAGNIAGKIRLIGSFQKQNSIPNSGILHLEARASDLIPNVRLRYSYDKTGIETFEDVTTLDVRSVAAAEIGYRTYNFLVVSLIYRWYFIEDEERPNTYVPVERFEPRVSFSYEF